MHQYASDTSESRELIAELEFVWEQVKSNSLSSSSSSRNREFRAGQQQQQDPRSSYVTLSDKVTKDTTGAGGLRILQPMSHRDFEDGDVSEDVEEAPISGGPEALIRNGYSYNLHNGRWRKRIEKALMHMTAEIAALKEQMEARGGIRVSQRSGLWSWLTWFVWASIKHVVVDALLLTIYVTWSRWKHHRTVGQQLQMLANSARQRAEVLHTQKLRRFTSSLKRLG